MARSFAWAVDRVIGTGVRVVACVAGRCDWLRTVIGRGVTSVSVTHGFAAVTGSLQLASSNSLSSATDQSISLTAIDWSNCKRGLTVSYHATISTKTEL